MNALVLVDIQNDFLPGGALAVTDSDQIVPVANAWMDAFDMVVATQDWHPANHLSFASQHEERGIGDVFDLDGLTQIVWPDHCVQNSAGAELAADLELSKIDFVCPKGMDRNIDSYSGFFDNGHRHKTELGDWLSNRSVDELHVMGLATDYCVKCTVLDALELGFATKVLLAGCRGVELQAGDIESAVQEMKLAGAEVVRGPD